MGKRITIAALALLVVAASGIWWIASAGGFSTRQEPTAMEAMLARKARRLAIPSNAKNLPNPVELTPAVMDEARRHYADHCATCHANDGSGNTEMGKNLYPKAPDMRGEATQSLTDGELYFVIQNGIRLSGMPAWGEKSDHDHASWALVHFIRRLPQLSPTELQDMRQFNPVSRMELKEEQEEEEFLNGESEKK